MAERNLELWASYWRNIRNGEMPSDNEKNGAAQILKAWQEENADEKQSAVFEEVWRQVFQYIRKDKNGLLSKADMKKLVYNGDLFSVRKTKVKGKGIHTFPLKELAYASWNTSYQEVLSEETGEDTVILSSTKTYSDDYGIDFNALVEVLSENGLLSEMEKPQKKMVVFKLERDLCVILSVIYNGIED